MGALDAGRAVALVQAGDDGAVADPGRWHEVIKLGAYLYIELTVLLRSEGKTEPSVRAKHMTADNTFSHWRAHPRKACGPAAGEASLASLTVVCPLSTPVPSSLDSFVLPLFTTFFPTLEHLGATSIHTCRALQGPGG